MRREKIQSTCSDVQSFTSNENIISDFLAIKLSTIIITFKTFNYFQQTGDSFPKFYYF